MRSHFGSVPDVDPNGRELMSDDLTWGRLSQERLYILLLFLSALGGLASTDDCPRGSILVAFQKVILEAES